MKYLLLFVLLIFGCNEMEVGQCREYKSSPICDPDQLERNRQMIKTCAHTTNKSMSICSDKFSDMGCTYDSYVICRQTKSQFISFNKKPKSLNDASLNDASLNDTEAEAYVEESQ